MGFGPPSGHELKIFDTVPPATDSTFKAGVPSTATQQEALSIILFSPNLQLIASLDNTGSKVTSSYTTSVTTGFTFSSTQSLSITEEIGVNIEIVTEKTSITFALSFTEQWSKSTTQSMTFSCPPGELAYVYQGTLMSRVLELDAESAEYKWYTPTSRALTQVLVTKDTPIGKAPSNPVTLS
ncbi:hypothetical protein [Salipiger mucosus]|uniref:Uncharacterized protein n=1 Tax=Salipiger mucosus DSM 16094 TaxID=1123237 RepID=S9QRN0_9RHOB|nr:hypothetical protein [Salipiger mucosus]EPX82293.1 hypothetical protein Salmuc_03081 [Salipiger mucosus DSM 16094]